MAILLLAGACGSNEQATSPPSVSSEVSAPRAESPSPHTPSINLATTLSCSTRPSSGHPLMLLLGAEPGELDVLDTSDSIQPSRLCRLSSADGGRFISATRIAFWSGRYLAYADLASGAVVPTGQLSDTPSQGTFSGDGQSFAYRVGDDTNGLTTHLIVGANDRVLVSRPGIGGHGGPLYGPRDQLAFSADGKYLLSVDSLFANFASGPPNFIVYGMDGSTVFQSSMAAFGTWAPTGAKLYFLAPSQSHGVSGSLHSWDASNGEATVASGQSLYVWPTISPSGTSIVFTSYDPRGLPHVWQIDLATHSASQISQVTSSHPVFVGRDAIWSNEETPCDCGLGGASAPDGLAISRDLVTGTEGNVRLDASILSGPTNAVVDVWIPRA